MNPTNQPKPKPKTIKNDALVEQLRDLGSGVGKSIKQDLFGGMAQDALSSLFGAPKVPKSGTLAPDTPVQLGNQPPQPQETVKSPYRLPFMPERFPYPMRKKEPPKPLFTQEQINRLKAQEQEVSHKIEEVRQELKSLILEIKSVDKEIQKAVNQNVVEASLYHMNFFDRLKTILKMMLVEMKSSRSWLTTQQSRKKQRGYWQMYKKKGTSFGLSGERNVATQVG